MASQIASLLSRGQERLHALQGSPVFTWLGTDYDCTASTLRRGTVLIVGGLEAEIALTLSVVISEMEDAASQPTAGKTLIYDSVTYRIARVGKIVGSSHYEIELISPHK